MVSARRAGKAVAPQVKKAGTAKAWVPERRDIIWIDCSPQAGREMRDLHPLLVISPKNFNAKTGLVIGLPMTSAGYNATNPFAIAAGAALGRKAGKVSYVLCHQPKSFDWRARNAKPHPLKRLADAPFAQACGVLNQIVELA